MARPTQHPDVHIGTSGWTYDDWNGVFYPPAVRGAERLAYYAQHFDAVEVNATFYRFPSAAMVNAWNRHLPDGFQLVVKGHRSITHLKRLRDVGGLLARFIDAVTPLRHLKGMLWQLHPQLARDDARLAAFLEQLPLRWWHAVEFRHESWWHPAVAALLARHGAGFVGVSHLSLPDTVFPTADFLYLRFHGVGPRLYDYDYADRELAAWVRRVAPHLTARTLYAFFNNDCRAQAIGNARRFRELLVGA